VTKILRLTKEQQRAIKRKAEQVRVYNPRSEDANYRILRRRAQGVIGIGCAGTIALFWCNMWLAIEPDGYTHS
jgi:hypothetical protein